MNLFQVIFIPLCLLLSVRAGFRTWRRRMPRRLGILSILVWGAAAFAIACPDSTIVLASWLGIGRGTDLLLYVAILSGMLASLYFYHRCRQLENLLTTLIRRDAIFHAKKGPAVESAEDHESRQDSVLPPD